VGMMTYGGATFVIRRKFSASQYGSCTQEHTHGHIHTEVQVQAQAYGPAHAHRHNCIPSLPCGALLPRPHTPSPSCVPHAKALLTLHAICLCLSVPVCISLTYIMVWGRRARFWRDVAETKCTVIQYIGELCRYLLAAPPSPHDRAHRVRIAIGNGLRYGRPARSSIPMHACRCVRVWVCLCIFVHVCVRDRSGTHAHSSIMCTPPSHSLSLSLSCATSPDVWDAFQDRFAIPEIGEFYGSTEGNASLINHAVSLADRGAVGRQGWLLRRLLGFRLVRFDIERDEPVRGPGGTHAPTHT
jgi:hypothetical protein